MRILEFATLGAILVLHASIACAKHSHEVRELLERRHRHHVRGARTSKAQTGLRTESAIKKRTDCCEFPSDAGLVAVTPDRDNGGWAMSPDQKCTKGTYCPYACPPGEMMAQGDPEATSYPSMVSYTLYVNPLGSADIL